MVDNLTYMGVLRCGDARSELMPELQIIPQEEFEAAQRIRKIALPTQRKKPNIMFLFVPVDRHLLSNNVYCGHCVQGSP